MKKVYILYDSSAYAGNTNNAAIYTIANSEQEAKEDSKDPSWKDGIWYEYELKGNKLRNEKIRFDLMEDQMEEITVFKTEDGETFNTKEEALRHELLLAFEKIYDDDKVYESQEGGEVLFEDFMYWLENNKHDLFNFLKDYYDL